MILVQFITCTLLMIQVNLCRVFNTMPTLVIDGQSWRQWERDIIVAMLLCFSFFSPYHAANLCGTYLLLSMPAGLRSLSVAAVTWHCVERFPVNDKVGISWWSHSHAFLQIIEARISICSLPTKVQTPADYIGIVHQTDHHYIQSSIAMWHLTTGINSYQILTNFR